MNKLSLRTRLIAVVVAVTIFALTAGGAATWIALRQSLYRRLDNQVQAAADDAQGWYQRQLDDGKTTLRYYGGPPGSERARDAALVAISTGDGDLIAVEPPQDPLNPEATVPDLKLDKGDVTKLASTANTISLRTTDGLAVHAASRALQDPLGNNFRLLVAVPTTSVTDTLTRLLVLELVVGGASVLAAIGLGSLGVRAGLTPLTRVTSTAHEIAQNLHSRGSGLERRVPGGDSSTEVGQLTKALNTMLSAAQAAYAVRVENENRMRRFLADASHELRTPLTSLRGYAELERLRAAAGADDPDATKDALRRIESEGDRMAKLVDDLLLLARADAAAADGTDGAVALGPVPMEAVIGEAIDRARAAHPGREFRIDADGQGLIAHADYETLLQVLGNLLRNAAIHTPGPRPVRIGAWLDRGAGGSDGRAVAVTIADEGPGMAPAQADHAFDRFWRADSGRTRATGGSGLGLPIVHALVEAQHGTVTLASRPDTGTTVTIRLPLAMEARGGGHPARSPVPASRYPADGGGPPETPSKTVGGLAYRDRHASIEYPDPQ